MEKRKRDQRSQPSVLIAGIVVGGVLGMALGSLVFEDVPAGTFAGMAAGLAFSVILVGALARKKSGRAE